MLANLMPIKQYLGVLPPWGLTMVLLLSLSPSGSRCGVGLNATHTEQGSSYSIRIDLSKGDGSLIELDQPVLDSTQVALRRIKKFES